MQQWIFKLIGGASLVSILLTGGTLDKSYEVPKEEIQAAQTAVKDAELDKWIDDLVRLESEGREDIVILDTNGYWSYGCLQYQLATFKRYYPLLGLESPQNESAWTTAIMSCDTQKALTRAILGHEKEGWRNWWTSVKKRGLGLPPA